MPALLDLLDVCDYEMCTIKCRKELFHLKYHRVYMEYNAIQCLTYSKPV